MTLNFFHSVHKFSLDIEDPEEKKKKELKYAGTNFHFMDRGALEYLGFSSGIAEILPEKLPKENLSYKNARIVFVVSNMLTCALTLIK